VTGCELITTPASGAEVHPDSFVTLNEYVFAASPAIVMLVPVPVTDSPGVRVSVQVPVGGRPLSKTLPVATAHAGWVTVPNSGAGTTGCGLILAWTGSDTHVLSTELLTLTL